MKRFECADFASQAFKLIKIILKICTVLEKNNDVVLKIACHSTASIKSALKSVDHDDLA